MKYTPKTTKKIIKLIEAGNFAKHDAESQGVEESTYYKWIKKYPVFRASIKRAKAKRIVTLMGKINENPSFQSSAWMLERLSRQHFHLQSVVEKEMAARLDEIEDKLDKYLSASDEAKKEVGTEE